MNVVLKIKTRLYGEDHPDNVGQLMNLGLVYANIGEYGKGIEYSEKALELTKKYYGEEHPHNAIIYTNLGLSYGNKGEYDKAIQFFEKSLQCSENLWC